METLQTTAFLELIRRLTWVISTSPLLCMNTKCWSVSVQRNTEFSLAMPYSPREGYGCYQFFASSLKNAVPQLSKLNAFGTGEEALSNAFHESFLNAVHVQCALHKRDNILTKLHALHVPQDDCKEIIGDIFGYQSGSTFFTRL